MWTLSAIASFTAFVARLQGAHRLHFEEAPRLHELVAHLSIAARIPRPHLYVARHPHPGALSLGTRSQASIIILTSAALGELDEAELCAMVAHELAHIAHGDTRRATLVAALAGMMRRAGGGGRGALSRWVLARLHRLGAPPARDFAADRAAAGLLGDALGLAALLVRLKARAAAHGAPGSLCGVGTSFIALDERIHRLERMAAEEQARRAKGLLRRPLPRGSRFHPRAGAPPRRLRVHPRPGRRVACLVRGGMGKPSSRATRTRGRALRGTRPERQHPASTPSGTAGQAPAWRPPGT